MKSYIFITTVHERESDDLVCHLEANTLESLSEQLRKIESAIKIYEAKAEQEKEDEETETLLDDEVYPKDEE